MAAATRLVKPKHDVVVNERRVTSDDEKDWRYVRRDMSCVR